MMEPEQVQRFTRELRAMLRAAADDPAAFRQAAELLDAARSLMNDAYSDLGQQGYSAADVAAELGVTRQAVRQRYGAFVPLAERSELAAKMNYWV